MTDIIKEVRAHLLDQQAVRQHVGDRIYPDVVPQNETLPAIRLEVVSDRPEIIADGHSVLRFSRLEVDVIAHTRKQANEISEAIDASTILGGFRGTAGVATIRSAIRINRLQAVEEPPDGSERWEYRTISDYEIFFQ